MKDKIVYIGYNFPDKSPAGVRAFANAKALKEYGYDVKLISKSDSEQENRTEVLDDMETWYIPRPKSKKDWFFNLVKANQYTVIIEKIENVKVVIAFEIPAISFLRLKKYCKRHGILLISEVGEWQEWKHLGHLGTLGRLVRVTDINLAIRYAYKKSNALIVTSHYFKEYYNDIVPTLVLPTLQFKRIEFPVKDRVNSVRKFIYAGGMGFHKDMLSDIIHAFAQLDQSDFEFNILGLTLEQYTERFPADAPVISLLNRKTVKVRFWGRVSHTEVLDAVSKSDFALIIRESSRRNNMGSPTKYGESINCGTPVIVSDFSDLVYYTKKYDVGIVTDVNTIAEGIQKAIDMDEGSLHQMRLRCKNCQAFYYMGHVTEIGEFVKSVYNK